MIQYIIIYQNAYTITKCIIWAFKIFKTLKVVMYIHKQIFI